MYGAGSHWVSHKNKRFNNPNDLAPFYWNRSSNQIMQLLPYCSIQTCTLLHGVVSIAKEKWILLLIINHH